MALNRIQSAAENIEFYYLDIIAFRPISNEIANRFRVEHQSPQLLIINKGECTFHTSHLDISTSVVEKQVGLLI